MKSFQVTGITYFICNHPIITSYCGTFSLHSCICSSCDLHLFFAFSFHFHNSKLSFSMQPQRNKSSLFTVFQNECIRINYIPPSLQQCVFENLCVHMHVACTCSYLPAYMPVCTLGCTCTHLVVSFHYMLHHPDWPL